MDATTTTATDATTPPPAEQTGKRARPPLDAAARDAQAKKRAVAKLLKKAKSAKDVDELRAIMTGQAEAKAETKDAPKLESADPADQPIAPGWPTQRQAAEAAPLAELVLGGLTAATKETRYDVGAEVMGGLSRADMLRTPLTIALAASKGDMQVTPGQALFMTAALVFVPVAVGHFVEEGIPALRKMWAQRQAQQQKPAATVAVRKFEKKSDTEAA